MTRYHLRLTKSRALLLNFGEASLTGAALTRLLPTAAVQSITPLADGYEVAVDLERQDHAQAMNDFETAFQQLGLRIVQATITELATSWLEGGAIGAISCAAVGAATKSAEAFVALLLAGSAVGALVGGQRQTAGRRLLARRAIGGWDITSLEPPPAGGADPAYS